MKCTHPIRIGYAERPCGQCTACRLNYSSMWSVRCVLESLGYKDNVFLTLTYNDEHLPKDKSVDKKTMQDFMKRFRKAIAPEKCRFFLSGEYGDQYKRPHYHLLIFGVSLHNDVFQNLKWDHRHQGFWCDCKAWRDEKGVSLGHCFIGTVTIASAQYVAKYVLKKIKGKEAKHKYEQLGVKPEFCLCSRKPGIGLPYLEQNKNTILRNGYISIEGHKFPLPRYYKEKFKQNVPFYELLVSGESLDRAESERSRFAKLYDELEDPYTYLQDEKKQQDMNINARLKIQGGLNEGV